MDLRTFTSETARRQWAKQTENAYSNLIIWRLRQGDSRKRALNSWEWYKGVNFELQERNSIATSALDRWIQPPYAQNTPAIATPSTVADHLTSLHERTVITYASSSTERPVGL